MKTVRLWLQKTIVCLLVAIFMIPVSQPFVGAGGLASAATAGNEIPEEAPLLVENGQPLAEIIVNADAAEMERYAAKELQSTIELVSGATLPIYEREELLNQTVSVSLGERRLEVGKGGNYDLSIIFYNGDNTVKAVSVDALHEVNPFDIAMNGGFSLESGQTGAVTASLFVPSSTVDGIYAVRFQPYVDGAAYGPELELTVQVQQSLLSNGGFETGTSSGWYALDGTGALDSGTKRSGNMSYRLGADNGNSFNVRSTQNVQTKPGSSYVLKAWMKGEQAGNARMQMSEVVGFTQKQVYAVDAAITTEWQPFEVHYTRDPEHQFDTNWIVFSFNRANGPGRLWIDDVTLIEVPDGPEEPSGPPAPGAITQGRFQIVLGTMDRLSEFTDIGEKYAEQLEGSDGFAVHSEVNRVFIVGDEPRGVLNGVYDFLEENAGVLWTRSSETGTLFEPQENLAVLKADYWERSPLQVRGWLTLGVSANNEIQGDYATDMMLARNKNNARMSAHDANRPYWERFKATGLEPIMLGHNLNYWLPNSEFFEDHPDYYNTDQEGNYIRLSAKTQFNFYHPDLPGVFAEKAKGLIAATGTEYVGVGLNDNSNFYQKGLSDQPFVTEEGIMVQPEDPAYVSTVFFTFLNKMAREVNAAYPDAKVVAYAYTLTEEPPKTALEDNIVVVYAPLYEDARTPINTDDSRSANYRYKQQLEAWSEKTKNVIVYNYYGSFPYTDFERPIAEKVQADMQYYRELGILGVLPEGTIDSAHEGWGVNAMQFWLMNKLFWNPDEDIEQLKTQFLDKAYGAASASMRVYYDLLEEGWQYDDAQQTWATSGKTLFRQYVVRPGIREAARAALDEAFNLADERAKSRIRPIKEAFERMAQAVGDNIDVSTNAIRTNYTKEQILSTFDFSAAPWSSVENPVTDFRHMQTGEAPLVDTKVYTLWDDEYLYIGYENFDHDVSQIRANPEAPNEWWLNGDDDSVETYLLDGMGTGYYALMSNSLGVNIDYSGPEVSAAWNGEWESAAVVKNDRWVVIQAIPFRTINVASPRTGTVVMGHYFRNYHRTGSGLGLYGWDGGAVWNTGEFKPIILVDAPSEPEPGGGAIFTPPVSGQPKPNEQIVSKEQLQTLEGKAVVDLAEGKDTLLLPLDAPAYLKDGVLSIRHSSATIELPGILLKQGLESAGMAAGPSSRIEVSIGTEAASDIDLANAAPAGARVAIKPAGDIVKLGLAVTDNKNERHELQSFEIPIKLLVNLAGQDASLLGFYKINHDGSLEYAGGEREGDRLAIEVTLPGDYVLLEWRQSYDDIPDGHWAREAIAALSAKHIVNGVSAAEFAPSSKLTRAQLASVIVRAFNLISAAEEQGQSFDDVSRDAWYADAVHAASAAGVVNGTGHNRFEPDAAVTREQMIVMLVRASQATAAGIDRIDPLAEYKDADQVSDWAATAWRVAVQHGWVQGKGMNRLAPKDPTSRAEIATMLYHMFGPTWQ